MNGAGSFNRILTGALSVLFTVLLSHLAYGQNTPPPADPEGYSIVAFQQISSPPSDIDGDGVRDVCDNCPGIFNPGQEDADANGSGNACDPDDDDDGYLDVDDQCPVSDRSPTVVINGCNSEIVNQLLPDGCTISDRIGKIGETATNHGEFISSVNHLLNELKSQGHIDRHEHGGIQRCAARSDTGKQSDTVTLITPYVNESDMEEIRDVFSSDYTISPPGRVHDGIDIYPDGDLKPFRAACSGRVHKIYTFSDQVTLFIACNPTYTIEYNFESQYPDSGQTQRENILVDEGDTVSQGEIIGYLYDADPNLAHVHFTLHKNWIPRCPEPYFDSGAVVSIENLIIQNLNMCYGTDVTPPALVTPYVTETDMREIKAGYSSDNRISPWRFAHDGIDIYPEGNLKPFQAACSGIVDSVELREAGADSNWQVDVLIQCDEYVFDPDDGGYFIPFSVDYVFQPISEDYNDGVSQLGNILVGEGDPVCRGDDIGSLVVAGEGAHVHFGLVQFGSSAFQALGITGIPLCPEPHFSKEAGNSILNLLHVAWPKAGMCYQK